MKLTVLGNNGPFAEAGGSCSGYLLEAHDKRILLDCGPGVLAQLERYCGIQELDAIFVSHLHYDHVSDLFTGIYHLGALKNAGKWKGQLRVIAPGLPDEVYHALDNSLLDWLAPNDCCVGPFDVKFMPVNHSVPAYAMRIECDGKVFVYTGDTNSCGGLPEFCSHADALLCDIGMPDELWSKEAPLMSAGLAGKLAATAQVGKLIVTHLNPLYDKKTLLSQAQANYPNAVLSEVGMQVEL